MNPAEPHGIIVELHPDGAGPALRQRLADATAAAGRDARIVYRAVIVEIVPLADARPAAVKLRKCLKALARTAGLRAAWHGEAKRRRFTEPTAKPAKRGKAASKRRKTDRDSPERIGGP